jgi:hypothetical protein
MITTFGMISTSPTEDLTKRDFLVSTNVFQNKVSHFLSLNLFQVSDRFYRHWVYESRFAGQRGVFLYLLCKRELLGRSELQVLPLSASA